MAEDILKLLLAVDAFRRERRFQQFLQTCELITESDFFSLVLWKCYEVAKSVSAEEFLRAGLSGKTVGENLNRARAEAILRVL